MLYLMKIINRSNNSLEPLRQQETKANLSEIELINIPKRVLLHLMLMFRLWHVVKVDTVCIHVDVHVDSGELLCWLFLWLLLLLGLRLRLVEGLLEAVEASRGSR